MAPGRRSPFGELIEHHLTRLKLTQAELAERSDRIAQRVQVDQGVSPRTVARYMAFHTRAGTWKTPWPRYVRWLAEALELQPGSLDYDRFLVAADEMDWSPSQPLLVDRSSRVASSPEFISAGREWQLERLVREIGAAVDGRSGALFVSGEPGTGKTWLIEEACRQALAEHEHLVVLWSQSIDPELTGGVATPYEPVRQLLRLMLGDTETVSRRFTFDSDHRQTLVRRVPAAAESLINEAPGLIATLLADSHFWRRHVSPIVEPTVVARAEAVSSLPARTGMPGPGLPEQLYRAISDYSRSGPVLIVLDDLHWADQDTISMLALLLRWLVGRPRRVIAIGAFRPGSLPLDRMGRSHPFTRLLDGLPRLLPDAVLDLSPTIEGDAGRAFVEAAMSREGVSGHPDLVDRLLQRTRGIPLFVNAYLRVHGAGDRATALANALDGQSIPGEARSVFAEQLHALPPESVALLEAASIQGDTFLAEVVMLQLGIELARFNEMTSTGLIWQFRMLEAAGDIALADATAHRSAFTHALLRGHVYERMTLARRRQLHIATAEAMIELYGDGASNAAGTIGMHLDSGGDLQRAARAYLDAGDHALTWSDVDDGIRYYSQALSLETESVDTLVTTYARIGLANCRRRQGNVVGARALAEAAATIARRLELRDAEAHAMETLALLDFDEGDTQRGVDRLRAVITQWSGQDDADAARAMANIGFLLYGVGAYDEMKWTAERSLEIADRIGDRQVWLDGWLARTNCLIDLGYYAEAEASYERGLAEARRIGDAWRTHLFLVNLTLCALEQVQWSLAEDRIRILLESDPPPVIGLVGHAEFDLGLAAEGQGALVNARSHYQRSLQIRLEVQQRAQVVDSLAGLLRVAVAHFDGKMVKELLADLELRIDHRNGLDGVEHPARALFSLIEAHELLGNLERAQAWRQRGVEFLEGRAERLSNPDDRASYLYNPPANRRIMELAERQ